MARVPLVKEQVIPSKLVLNVENVGLTEEQFFRLSSDNRDLFMELTAQKELIIMAPEGLNSSERGTILCYHLTDWARKEGTGVAYGPVAGDRKSTRLNSSHLVISYAVFCLKKKKKTKSQ